MSLYNDNKVAQSNQSNGRRSRENTTSSTAAPKNDDTFKDFAIVKKPTNQINNRKNYSDNNMTTWKLKSDVPYIDIEDVTSTADYTLPLNSPLV